MRGICSTALSGLPSIIWAASPSSLDLIIAVCFPLANAAVAQSKVHFGGVHSMDRLVETRHITASEYRSIDVPGGQKDGDNWLFLPQAAGAYCGQLWPPVIIFTSIDTFQKPRAVALCRWQPPFARPRGQAAAVASADAQHIRAITSRGVPNERANWAGPAAADSGPGLSCSSSTY